MIDFREILGLLSLDFEDRGDALMLVCPLPEHADTRASFRVWVNDSRFYCFGCEQSGDAADLYAAVRGLTKDEGLEEIEKLTGQRVAPRKEQPRQPEVNARGRGEDALTELRGKIPAADHAALGERLDKICWAYRKQLVTPEQLGPAIERFLRELPVVS